MKIRECSSSPVSRIFILNFLNESEHGVIRRLREDMITLVNAASSNSDIDTDFFNYIDIKSVQEFEHAIGNIIWYVKGNEKPLIHIQGHGDKNKGIACVNGDFISWEHLKVSLEKIILASNGELTVVAATCFSFKLTALVPYFVKMPYSFFYGYDGEVSLGDMEGDLSALYKNFLLNKDGFSGLSLKIKLHSEYDNMQVVVAALLLVYHPKIASEKGFSKRLILKGVKKFDIPASVQREIVNKIIKSEELIFNLVEKTFHPTQRREYLIEDISNYLSKIK